MNIHKNQHSVYAMTFHIVLVTKYRRPVISEQISAFLEQEAARLMPMYGGSLEEFGSEEDHVHLLVELPPTQAPAVVINNLKTQLSKAVRREYGEEVRKHLYGDAFWSASYFIASTGGASVEVLREYVASQRTDEHKRKYERSGLYKKKRRRKKAPAASDTGIDR